MHDTKEDKLFHPLKGNGLMCWRADVCKNAHFSTRDFCLDLILLSSQRMQTGESVSKKSPLGMELPSNYGVFVSKCACLLLVKLAPKILACGFVYGFAESALEFLSQDLDNGERADCRTRGHREMSRKCYERFRVGRPSDVEIE